MINITRIISLLQGVIKPLGLSEKITLTFRSPVYTKAERKRNGMEIQTQTDWLLPLLQGNNKTVTKPYCIEPRSSGL